MLSKYVADRYERSRKAAGRKRRDEKRPIAAAIAGCEHQGLVAVSSVSQSSRGALVGAMRVLRSQWTGGVDRDGDAVGERRC